MNKIFKTPEGAEFSALVDQFRGEGLTLDQIGELCSLSKQAVSLIWNGEREPGRAPNFAPLAQLRKAAQERSGSTYPAPAVAPDPLHDKLEALKQHPEHYAAATQSVEQIYELALMSARGVRAKLGHSPKVPSQSESESSQPGPAHPAPDRHKSPPAQAPKRRASGGS